MKTLITRWVSQMFTTAKKNWNTRNSLFLAVDQKYVMLHCSFFIKNFVSKLLYFLDLEGNSIPNLPFLISLPGSICSDRPKYFPWLTFNFRLRTGHKSELRYLRTQTRCFRVMLQWTTCGNGCVRMWYAHAGKKSCYLLRMLHPLVPLCNNLLTPGLLQTPLGQKLLSLQNLTPFGW